jgi:pyruvate,water dikinase
MNVVPLADADREDLFGGKAVSLGGAVRAGLCVPPGMAIAAPLVDAIAGGDAAATAALLESPHLPDGRLAVRSSAVGEDSGDASFAGQHATKLNVTRVQLQDAVRMVWESARTAGALAYRMRQGLPPHPRVGVVVQTLVEPIAAGVLFTRDPMTGADERVIEAAWGLGEAVVNGTVIPDRYRLDPYGRVLESVAGEKDVKIWYGDGEGTIELPVPADLRTALSLTAPRLASLSALADRCTQVWGPALDIEWAVAADDVCYLLQCRPITTLRPQRA